MNITLFRDIPEEKFYSMERYANNLRSEIGSQRSDITTEEFSIRMTRFVRPMRAVLRWVPVVKDYAFDLYFSRYVLYPWRAKKHQGDVNHVIDHSYAHLLYHLDPAKTIVTCHDLIPLEYEKDPVAFKVWKYSVEGMRKAAMIIADSEATKRNLEDYLGSRNDRIRVIYLGVEEKFKPIKDEKTLRSIERKYNLPDGERLLHVGNSLKYKNVEGILRAFAEVRDQRSEIRIRPSTPSRLAPLARGRSGSPLRSEGLYFIKVGSLTEAQEKLAKELGISDRIIRLKDVVEEDLPAIYNTCDVLVMPSHKEGFGFPVLEAMACGLPVVTSNVSSLPEVAGKAAALVDPNNHREIAEVVIKVFDNGLYRKELINAGLKRAKKFTWEKTAEKTVEVYEEVYERVKK